MPKVTRFGNLGQVFSDGKSELLNLLAGLSVIYEDLRIEQNALVTGEAQLGDLDKLGWEYRFIYFLRRSSVTLEEFRGGLTRIKQTAEFKAAQKNLSVMDVEYIRAAESYFQANSKTIKDFRNAFGGHLLDPGVKFATSHLSDVSGKVIWDSAPDGALQALELHFAANIVTGAICSKFPEGAYAHEEVRAISSVIFDGYRHAQGAMYALGHAFLWDKFGR